MSTIVTPTIILNRQGALVNSDNNSKQNHKDISAFNHNYYKYQMNRAFGPAGIITGFESLCGLGLYFLEKSPATLTNFLVSLAEYAQVYISGAKFLGTGEIGKERREGAVAMIQAFAGLGGLSNFIIDMIKGDHNDELPIWQKVGLSVASLINSGFMFFGYAEKSILGLTSRGMEHHECKAMQMNANSDMRVSASWFTMMIYPWITNIKLLKKTIDVVIPVLALRDALGHFAKDGISMVLLNKPNFKLPKSLSKIIQTVFFIGEGNENPGPSFNIFNTKWFLGEQGFRNKYIVPFSEALGCKLPTVKLVEEKNLEVSIPEKHVSLLSQENSYRKGDVSNKTVPVQAA